MDFVICASRVRCKPGKGYCEPSSDKKLTVIPQNVLDTVKQKWGNVTLSELYADARLEDHGIMYESLKGDDRRFLLVVCVTDPDMLDLIERKIELSEDMPRTDWDKTTVLEMFHQTMNNQDGWSYQDLKNESEARVAIVFCAITPEKIRLLELMFDLPKA
jgi:hypothetical protein